MYLSVVYRRKLTFPLFSNIGDDLIIVIAWKTRNPAFPSKKKTATIGGASQSSQLERRPYECSSCTVRTYDLLTVPWWLLKVPFH